LPLAVEAKDGIVSSVKRTSWLAAVCAVALATLSLAPAAPIAAVSQIEDRAAVMR